MECPTGLVYVPLDVTQGVPPFDFDPNPLADFINSGCDSTTSSCVVRQRFMKNVVQTYTISCTATGLWGGDMLRHTILCRRRCWGSSR